jgi:hypothetical protein
LGIFPIFGLTPSYPGAICKLELKYGLVMFVLGSVSVLPIIASRMSISGLPLPTPGSIPKCPTFAHADIFCETRFFSSHLS